VNPVRFVILLHRDDAGEHWDFMIEQESTLATWKLPADPADPDALPIQGTRIADHRKRYLDYEGPIAGGRGDVSRVDEGTCDVHLSSGREWQITLAGRRARGRFRLERRDPDADAWTLDRMTQ
jgi:hypothetical protein